MSSFYGDGPIGDGIEYHENIHFYFSESTFTYGWGEYPRSMGPDSGRGEGSYEIVGDVIRLFDVQHETNYPPLALAGDFVFRYFGDHIVMDQGNVNEPDWPSYYLIDLEKTDIGVIYKDVLK